MIFSCFQISISWIIFCNSVKLYIVFTLAQICPIVFPFPLNSFSSPISPFSSLIFRLPSREFLALQQERQQWSIKLMKITTQNKSSMYIIFIWYSGWIYLNISISYTYIYINIMLCVIKNEAMWLKYKYKKI